MKNQLKLLAKRPLTSLALPIAASTTGTVIYEKILGWGQQH